MTWIGEESHTHILAGGRDVAEEESIEAAYRYARRLGHNPARLKVKVSTNPERGHFPHTIDVASGEFVTISRGIGLEGVS